MAHTMRAVLILVALRSTHARILNESTHRPTPVIHRGSRLVPTTVRPLQPRSTDWAANSIDWRLGFSQSQGPGPLTFENKISTAWV